MPQKHFLKDTQKRRVLRMVTIASAVNCHLMDMFLIHFKYLVTSSTKSQKSTEHPRALKEF